MVHSFALLVCREQAVSDHRQFLFEDEVHSVLKSVGNNNSAVVCEQNDAAAGATFSVKEEDVLAHLELAGVITSRFILHCLGEQPLAISQHTLNQRNFILAHFDLQFFLEELDHALMTNVKTTNDAFNTYLDNELLQSFLVFWFGPVNANDEVSGFVLQLLETFVTSLHALNSHLVCLRRDLDLLLDVEVLELEFELLVDEGSAELDLLVFLSLVDTLSHNLGLEGFFVGVLLHHALELKRVSIEGYIRHFLKITITYFNYVIKQKK